MSGCSSLDSGMPSANDYYICKDAVSEKVFHVEQVQKLVIKARLSEIRALPDESYLPMHID